MKQFLQKNRAETLIEVIIAVSILMVIMAPASALYISSTRTIAGNRNDLIAAALAEEGIEMVRNMRDTNLLRFSPKATNCWNTRPEHEDLSNCEAAGNKIAAGRYRLTLNPSTLAWELKEPVPSESQLAEPADNPADSILAAGNIEEYRLRHDLDISTIPACTAPSEPTHCTYHTSLYFSPPAGFSDTGTTSPFYRQITIDYLDLDGSGAADSADPAMRVTSLVQYRRGSRTDDVRNVKRVLILTNQPS